MKLPHQFLNFYLDASIHVALAVLALVQITGLILDTALNMHFSYYLFFGTIACYNFVKYGVEAKKYLLVTNKHHKKIQVLSLFALAFSGYHFYFLTWQTWLGIGVVSLLTALYTLPILPHTKNLRSIGILKILLVGLVWAGSTVVLPMLAVKALFSWDVWVETTQRFLLILILLVPFEIRDQKIDAPELRTLPQRLGTAKTRRLALIALGVFYALTYLKDAVLWIDILGKAILCLGLVPLLLATKEQQSKYFASFWIEAVPIFWWVVLLLLAIRY